MKKIYIALVAASLVAAAHAKPLSPAQALQRSQVPASAQRLATPARFSTADLSFTLQDAEAPVLYIFAKPGAGFAITAADDIAEPLLAYSDNADFNPNDIPENMLWWLNEYKREIEQARKSGVQFPLKSFNRPERQPIAPLCVTKWNQAHPYNDLCPTINGQYTYSGCVATAMAQVMKHHNWPKKGKGSASYQWGTQTLSMNFASTTFDWEHMTPIYNAQSTEEENHAVAELMKACGYSVQMNYGLSGSGAQSAVVPRALTRNFYYGNSTTYLTRAYVPLMRWENLIYESLTNNAPVYYSGQNMTVGHAFVCDGYSQDGYFHFNWGWGGVSDGYFRLTALDPSSQGIGGSNDGYNINQGAIINALPDTLDLAPTPFVLSNEQVSASYNADDSTLKMTGSFYNSTLSAFNLTFGLQLNNLKSGESTIYSTGETVRLASHATLTEISVAMPKPAAGLYTVVPMYDATPNADSHTWEEMLMPLGEPTIAYLEVTDNNEMNFTYPEYDLMQADSLDLLTPLYSGAAFKLKLNIKNTLPSEVYEYFFVSLLKDNNVVALGDPYSIDLPAEGNESIDFIGNFGNIAAGSYDIGVLQLVGNSAYLISDRLPVTVQTANTTDVAFSNLVIENASGVASTDIHYSFNIKVESGYFTSPITTYVVDRSGEQSVTMARLYSPYQFLNEGTSKKMEFTCSLPELEIGKTYHMGVGYSNRILLQKQFTVATNSVGAIENTNDWNISRQANSIILSAPENISTVQVYDMAGIQHNCKVTISDNQASVSTAALGHGTYLLRAATSTSSRTFKIAK